MTPTFNITFCKVLNRLVDDFKAATGHSDSSLSKLVLNHPNGLKALRSFQGVGHSPTIAKMLQIEVFIRDNWADDAKESERLYQDSLRRALVENGVGNDIDNP